MLLITTEEWSCPALAARGTISAGGRHLRPAKRFVQRPPFPPFADVVPENPRKMKTLFRVGARCAPHALQPLLPRDEHSNSS